MADPLASKMKLLLESEIHVAVLATRLHGAGKVKVVRRSANPFFGVSGHPIVVKVSCGRIRVRFPELSPRDNQLSGCSAMLDDPQIAECTIGALGRSKELLSS
jgi:hypothetical protein